MSESTDLLGHVGQRAPLHAACCGGAAGGEGLPNWHARENVSPVNAANLNAFRQGLRDAGYVEGKNFVIEYRSAEGRDDQFPGLADDLVRLKVDLVDLIVTRGTQAALAAKNATGTIPVVITGLADPVGQGIVASLARPGGNITGVSAIVTELYGKRVELLRELLPKASRIAVLFNMGSPALPPAWKEIETAARSLDIQPQLLDVRKPEDLGPAFDGAVRQRADALVVGLDTLTQASQRVIVDLAARHRLPAVYASMEFAGGLVIYGVNYPDHIAAPRPSRTGSSKAPSRGICPSSGRRGSNWSSTSRPRRSLA